MSIPEVLSALPKARGGKMPLVGGLFYLLMIGDVPTREQAMQVEAEWAKRAEVPDYVYKMLKSMPKDTHPMILLTQAVLALGRESAFHRQYDAGMKKDVYWEPALEDCMDLTAKIPVIAAFIYRYKYLGKSSKPRYNPRQDYGLNFARLLNVADRKGYADLSRLYFILHSDHESGNVSAHTTHLVGSALSDIYYAYAAGLAPGCAQEIWRRPQPRRTLQVRVGHAERREGHPGLRACRPARSGSALHGPDGIRQGSLPPG
jgi:citrate synthase